MTFESQLKISKCTENNKIFVKKSANGILFQAAITRLLVMSRAFSELKAFFSKKIWNYFRGCISFNDMNMLQQSTLHIAL